MADEGATTEVRTTQAPSFDVLLSDGSTARVRPIRPTDRQAALDFHARLSGESTRLRFFTVHPTLSDDEVALLVHLNGPDDLALVVERGDALVAIAQYDRIGHSDEAEVAFVVEDAFHGYGLATLLLEHLASVARHYGIKRFSAVTLAENAAMQAVFANAGFSRQTGWDGGEVRVVLDIAPSLVATRIMEERDRLAMLSSMIRLLRPRSIAVVGASATPGTVGHQLVANLVNGGFQGPLYPVSPSAAAITGVPCWPTISEVPTGVDLALVAVPPDELAGVVTACGQHGVGALVVVPGTPDEAGGRTEVGGSRYDTDRQIARLAHLHGMRVLGPNSFGVINTDPTISMNATFAAELPAAGPIGFASQAGSLGTAILAEARRRGLGLSAFVSTGDKADVSGNDLLTWWEQDGDTGVILLYLESFGNPRKFHRIARRVARSKPIVAVKGRRALVASAVKSSYPAVRTSAEAAVDALFRQTGVIQVDTVEELLDASQVLADQPLPRGNRVAILTNADGLGVLAADACAARNLELPEPSDVLKETLQASVPGASVSNPVDLAGPMTAALYGRCLRMLIESGEVDAVVAIFAPPVAAPIEGLAQTTAREIADIAGNSAVPIVATFLGVGNAAIHLRTGPRPVPCFSYPETAVRALAHAVDYAAWRDRPEGNVPDLEDVDPNEARRRLAAASIPDPSGWVQGADALAVLSAYGIPVAPSPGTATNPGVETVAAFVSDPAFGPHVLFGRGGTSPALINEPALRLAPLTDVDAWDMVRAPSAAILSDAPGEDPGVEALVGILLRISRLAEDLPELAEAELNPIVTTPSGTFVAAARMRSALSPSPSSDEVRHLR